MLECSGDVRASPGMHWRDLDDGAAGSHQPVEALASREQPDRTCRRAPCADQGNARQMRAHRIHVDLRVQGDQALLVQLYARTQIVLRRAREDDADVDELLALDTR